MRRGKQRRSRLDGQARAALRALPCCSRNKGLPQRSGEGFSFSPTKPGKQGAERREASGRGLGWLSACSASLSSGLQALPAWVQEGWARGGASLPPACLQCVPCAAPSTLHRRAHTCAPTLSAHLPHPNLSERKGLFLWSPFGECGEASFQQGRKRMDGWGGVST